MSEDELWFLRGEITALTCAVRALLARLPPEQFVEALRAIRTREQIAFDAMLPTTAPEAYEQGLRVRIDSICSGLDPGP